MAINTNIATSIVNTFNVTKGHMRDAHRDNGTIIVDALVARKDKDGNILNICAVLFNKIHSVNRVEFVNDSLTLTRTSIGVIENPMSNVTDIVKYLNDKENFMCTEVYKRPQDIFWAAL